jgi:hypothetical protein
MPPAALVLRFALPVPEIPEILEALRSAGSLDPRKTLKSLCSCEPLRTGQTWGASDSSGSVRAPGSRRPRWALKSRSARRPLRPWRSEFKIDGRPRRNCRARLIEAGVARDLQRHLVRPYRARRLQRWRNANRILRTEQRRRPLISNQDLTRTCSARHGEEPRR